MIPGTRYNMSCRLVQIPHCPPGQEPRSDKDLGFFVGQKQVSAAGGQLDHLDVIEPGGAGRLDPPTAQAGELDLGQRAALEEELHLLPTAEMP